MSSTTLLPRQAGQVMQGRKARTTDLPSDHIFQLLWAASSGKVPKEGSDDGLLREGQWRN